MKKNKTRIITVTETLSHPDIDIREVYKKLDEEVNEVINSKESAGWDFVSSQDINITGTAMDTEQGGIKQKLIIKSISRVLVFVLT